jgi:hypothetical protein
MRISRKRRNDNINIYLNNRRLEQVKEIKYLEIYFDSRLKFDKHIENIAEKSTTLIYMLGISAKLQWGLGHKSLKTIYEGALIPILTYGAPVWEQVAAKDRNIRKLQRAQRLINIKIAKTYRTISFEASCLMVGVPPIRIVIAEKVQLYKKSTARKEMHLNAICQCQSRTGPHPARRVFITETSDLISYATQIYRDGSKIGGKVGAGVAVYTDKMLVRKCKYKLQDYCSNNQAEQIIILKSLELLTTLEDHNTRTVAIYTDSKVTLASLKNSFIQSSLIEEICNMVGHLTMLNWTMHFG